MFFKKNFPIDNSINQCDNLFSLVADFASFPLVLLSFIVAEVSSKDLTELRLHFSAFNGIEMVALEDSHSAIPRVKSPP